MIEDRLENLEDLGIKFRLFGKKWRITPKTIGKSIGKAIGAKAKILAGLTTIGIGTRLFPVLASGYILYKVGGKIFKAKRKEEVPPNAEPVSQEEIIKMVETGQLPKEEVLGKTEGKKNILKSPYLYIGIGGALLTIILLATKKKKGRR